MGLTLGLDIGIASVGWCVLDYDAQKVLGLGVRTFKSAETPKDGSPLALPRRLARSARRRLRRRRQRLDRIHEWLVTSQIAESEEEILGIFGSLRAAEGTPYQLRSEGLDRRLERREWIRVLLHLAKHRGFKSNRKSVEEKDKETGALLAGIRENETLLREKKYRTVGEMLYKDERYSANKRNKAGSYKNTLSRGALEQEAHALFDAQRRFGSPYASAGLEEQYVDMFGFQLPFATSGDILAKVGACTFEPNEKRAPKLSYTAEYFALLTKLNNTRISDIHTEDQRELTPGERQQICSLAFEKTEVSYAQIRKKIALDDNEIFSNLRYQAKDGQSGFDLAAPEKQKFVKLRGYHEMKKAVSAVSKELWTAVSANPDTLDEIALILTCEKSDETVKAALDKLFSERQISLTATDALLSLSFQKFQHLSIKAMKKIIPWLEQGMRYDQACERAGYSHFAPGGEKKRTLLLPALNADDIRNPVVLRALAQVRKVVNAVIRKYGPMTEIHVEVARELKKSFDERRKIEKQQEDNRKAREHISDDLRGTFPNVFASGAPKGGDILKYRLFKEQNGQCAYSGTHFDRHRLFENNYTEVDHILPYSRTFNDSYANKVLVLSEENRNKGNRTPYEYMGGSEGRWNRFTGWVEATIKDRRKRQNLLRKELDDETTGREWKDRNLIDTSDITRFASNWMQETLQFAPGATKRPVLTTQGQFTALLRGRWGLAKLKNREESDRHHALDAAVVAAVTRKMIERVAHYSQNRELNRVSVEPSGERRRDPFPEPWPGFRHELRVFLSEDPQKELEKTCLSQSYSEEEQKAIRPIFVSRAPERKATGEAHEETIRSVKRRDPGRKGCVSKIKLTSLKPAMLDNLVEKDRDRKLCEALKKRLDEFGGKPEKAFAEPFYKPTNDGTRGPVVRAVKVYDTNISGLKVRGGQAGNGAMVRVDVYAKGGKYFLVPHYVADIAKGIVKKRAIVAHKDEEDWTPVDGSYDFCFSLHRNDLIKVVDSKKQEHFGYYQSVDRASGAVEIAAHDSSWLHRGIGVKTCQLFEKYEVTYLGEYHKVGMEKRPESV